jgi:hypothetical protein
MSAYDDLLSGALPLPSAASGSSDNWLSDLGSAVSSIASGVGSFFINQQAIKGAMKVQQAQGGGTGLLQYPGLGYSARQVVPYGAMQPSQGALPGTVGMSLAGAQTGMVQNAGYFNLGPQGLQIGDGSAPSSSSSLPMAPGQFFNTPSQMPTARAARLVWGQNPVNGKMHVWKHVGSLEKIVRLGLRACGATPHRRRRARGRYCPR